MKIGVIGCGSIGTMLVEHLAGSQAEGLSISGVLTRSAAANASSPWAVRSLDELLAASDVVVEAAGHRALAEYGEQVVSAGVDLLVVSVGALADDALWQALQDARPGRVLLTAGAIGGLDVAQAVAIAGDVRSVQLTTTKHVDAIVQPWMTPSQVQQIRESSAAVQVFSGSAREAALRFPQTANVAATLALATVGFDRVEVSVIADAQAQGATHNVEIDGAVGSYAFTFRNAASERNPRTSALTGYAVLRALFDLTRRVVVV